MNSIKTKLLVSYIAIIFIMLTLLLLVGVFDYTLTSKYEQISNNIVQEQALSDAASGMVQDAYNGFKSNDYSNYYQRINDIQSIEKKLDTQTDTTEESIVAYRSAKNSLSTIIQEIELAKNKLAQSGDITGISEIYQAETTKFEYVQQSIDVLILTETKTLASVTKDIQKTKTNLLYAFGLISFLISAVAVGCAFVFSNKLISPIITLADTAKKIADDDDLSVNVKDYLLHMNDETGSLSTSFNAMLLKLRKKIDEQATFNSALEKAIAW